MDISELPGSADITAVTTLLGNATLTAHDLDPQAERTNQSERDPGCRNEFFWICLLRFPHPGPSLQILT